MVEYIFVYGTLMPTFDGVKSPYVKYIHDDFKEAFNNATPATLLGYTLVTTVCTKYPIPGIKPHETHDIMGLLIPASEDLIKRLDQFESVGYFYDRIEVETHVFDGDRKTVKAWVYIPTKGRIDSFKISLPFGIFTKDTQEKAMKESKALEEIEA